MTRPSIVLLCLAILIGGSWLGCGSNESRSPFTPIGAQPPAEVDFPGMAIGPIPGFTTGWHALERNVTLPVPGNVEIRLCTPIPEGGEVVWTGARLLKEEKGISYAACPPSEPMEMLVSAATMSADGEVAVAECRFRVLDLKPADLEVGEVKLPPRAPDIDIHAGNAERVAAYFSPQAIARIVEVKQGHLRTSVNNPFSLGTTAQRSGLHRLVEWRINGRAVSLGSRADFSFEEAGAHRIEVGPPGRAREFRVDTYEVDIEGPRSRNESIPLSRPVTFKARTNPPGYEDEVLWISATKFGTAEPARGQGETFTVTFRDTMVDGYQWLGVKAAAATQGQDVFLFGGNLFLDPAENFEWREAGAGEVLHFVVIAAGASGNNHTITWSVNPPSISVSPSVSNVTFDVLGETLVLEFTAPSFPTDQNFTVTGSVSGPDVSGDINIPCLILKNNAPAPKCFVQQELFLSGVAGSRKTSKWEGNGEGYQYVGNGAHETRVSAVGNKLIQETKFPNWTSPSGKFVRYEFTCDPNNLLCSGGNVCKGTPVLNDPNGDGKQDGFLSCTCQAP